MGPYQQFRMNYDEEPIEEEAPESVKKEQLKAPWSRTTFLLCTVTEWDQDLAITAPQERRNKPGA